jgi:hypothetical protein
VGRRLSSGLAPGIVGRVERANRTSVQAAISAELMVPAEFDAAVEVERRVTFLVEQLAGNEVRGRRVRPGAARGAHQAARPDGSAGARRRARDRRQGAHGRASERPGLPDEHVFGVTYEQIDDFPRGSRVAPEVHEIIVSTYRRTAHKRALPATP